MLIVYALAMDPSRLATDRRAKAIVGVSSTQLVRHVWPDELAAFPRAAMPLMGGKADVTSGWVTSTVVAWKEEGIFEL